MVFFFKNGLHNIIFKFFIFAEASKKIAKVKMNKNLTYAREYLSVADKLH